MGRAVVCKQGDEGAFVMITAVRPTFHPLLCCGRQIVPRAERKDDHVCESGVIDRLFAQGLIGDMFKFPPRALEIEIVTEFFCEMIVKAHGPFAGGGILIGHDEVEWILRLPLVWMKRSFER